CVNNKGVLPPRFRQENRAKFDYYAQFLSYFPYDGDVDKTCGFARLVETKFITDKRALFCTNYPDPAFSPEEQLNGHPDWPRNLSFNPRTSFMYMPHWRWVTLPGSTTATHDGAYRKIREIPKEKCQAM